MNKDKVRGIPKLRDQPKHICGECPKGEQVKNTLKKIQEINTTNPLYLLHMDLIGLIVLKVWVRKDMLWLYWMIFLGIPLCVFLRKNMKQLSI